MAIISRSDDEAHRARILYKKQFDFRFRVVLQFEIHECVYIDSLHHFLTSAFSVRPSQNRKLANARRFHGKGVHSNTVLLGKEN